MTSRWSRVRPAAVALFAVAGLAPFLWLSGLVYQSKKVPESFRAWDGTHAWIVGPPASALEHASRERVEAGLEHLNDSALPATERVRRYREELSEAEALLLRSIRAQPAQARALAALAAVRWELDPPLTEAAVRSQLDLIASASRVAPTYPEVKRRLGELLLKMGRRDEATDYLAAAVQLNPDSSRQVVQLMNEYLFTAEQIHDALPRHPQVLMALELPYREDGQEAEYLTLLDQAIDDRPEPLLLLRFGTTCLKLGQADRILERMDSLGEQSEAAVEAARLRQRARALVALGRAPEAVADARLADRLEPETAQAAEFLGDTALRAGEYEAAVTAFTDALGRLARASIGQGVRSRSRARVYRKIGETREAQGRPDRAYDAYRRALEIDADEPNARRRVSEMEQAAGFD